MSKMFIDEEPTAQFMLVTPEMAQELVGYPRPELTEEQWSQA